MLRKLGRFLGVAFFAAILAAAPPAVVHADTFYLTIWWIRCDDQSEPGSDEIRLRFAGLGPGGVVAGWNDVDGHETHWYYSSMFMQPVNISYGGGNPSIDVMELDSEMILIGWVNTFASEVDQGAREKRMNAYDGNYVIRYEIRSTPL